MVTCRLCEEDFAQNDVTYYHDAYYCPECLNKIKAVFPITNYSYKPTVRFYDESTAAPQTKPQKTSSDFTKLYLGVELEIDDGVYSNKTASAINDLIDGSFFYCKHDGSLENNGFEIVSHPATLKFWETKVPLETLRKICTGNDFRSDETSTCGLHVHVNRDFFGNTRDEQEEAIAKLILLVNRFWTGYIVPFSRRNESNLNRWARKNCVYGTPILSNDKNVYGKIDNDDRYYAINLQNSETIEFRLFKGSLNVQTILATLQLVDRLCHLARKINLKTLIKISWTDIVGFKNCHKELKSYLETRHLLPTECSAPFDTVVSMPPRRKRIKVPKGFDKRLLTLKVGDLVTIKPWDVMEKEFGMDYAGNINCRFLFTNEMSAFCCQTYVIRDISPSSDDSLISPIFTLSKTLTSNVAIDAMFSWDMFVYGE